MELQSFQTRTNRLFGVPIDFVGRLDAVELAMRAMRERFRLQCGDVNVSKLVDMQSDSELRRCTEESDIICADGIGIVWACRLLGIPVKGRVAGIDLMGDMIAECARNGFRPYFLGAKQDVLEDFVARLRAKYPNLQVAGWRNGYFAPADEPEIVSAIKASGADCLFVGITSPIKERFLNRYRDALGVPVQLGVGGSFDVLSGNIMRAPIVLQKIGLEWLFRLLQEPRRLARRYCVSNSIFIALILRDMIGGARNKSTVGSQLLALCKLPPRLVSIRPNRVTNHGSPRLFEVDLNRAMLTHFIRRAVGECFEGRNVVTEAPARAPVPCVHLHAAVDWLIRSIEVCDGRSSSKGYRFAKGWMTAYPETSGYIIPTLLALAREEGDPKFTEMAQAIGRWLVEIQRPDGGFSGRELGIQSEPDVFDTGMILLGLNALIHQGTREPYMQAGQRAAQFLVDSMDESGCFVRNMSHNIVHAYNVRAAWGLVAFGRLALEKHFEERGADCAHWTIAQQNKHGFYLSNHFKPGGNANTHGTAYVMRGLLQIYYLQKDDRILHSVRRAADQVCHLFDQNGWIAAELGSEWQYLSPHICLTGYAQFAIILYRLFVITGRTVYKQTADGLLAYVARRQPLEPAGAPWRGAIAGSYPIYGRYAPLQYPNWATKFFIDAILAQRFVHAGGTAWPEIDLYGG